MREAVLLSRRAIRTQLKYFSILQSSLGTEEKKTQKNDKITDCDDTSEIGKTRLYGCQSWLLRNLKHFDKNCLLGESFFWQSHRNFLTRYATFYWNRCVYMEMSQGNASQQTILYFLNTTLSNDTTVSLMRFGHTETENKPLFYIGSCTIYTSVVPRLLLLRSSVPDLTAAAKCVFCIDGFSPGLPPLLR